MNVKGLAAITFFLLIVLIISFIYRLGGFKTVTVVESEAGPFYVISKHHLGAYHKIVSVIEEVEKWTKAHNEPCRLSFGEYIDNVDTAPEDRLNSNGGCILEKNTSGSIENPGETKPADFEYRIIPRRRYVQAVFDGAPSIGPMKVYPKVMEYLAAKNEKLDGPVIEIYEIIGSDGVLTRYYFPFK